MGTNSFYHVLRDARGPSPQTVCRTVRQVAEAIFTLRNEVIRWPENCDKIVKDFYDIARYINFNYAQLTVVMNPCLTTGTGGRTYFGHSCLVIL